MDLGGQRALGLGSVSLGPLVSPREIRLGMVPRGTALAACLASGLGGVLRLRNRGPIRGLERVRRDRMVPAGSGRSVRAVVRAPLLLGRQRDPRGQQREHLQQLPERARLPRRFVCRHPGLRTRRPADPAIRARCECPAGSRDSRPGAGRPGTLQPRPVGSSPREPQRLGAALLADESSARVARRHGARVVRVPAGALAELDQQLPHDV